MFEKWRIKEHMEVTDSAGRHVGTVDEVDGDTIKLTRSDAADGRHHLIDIDSVDKIDDNRVYLKAGTPLPAGLDSRKGETVAGTQSRSVGGQSQGYDGDTAQRQGFAGEQGTARTSGDTPIFGTSGHGTGMGGSGTS